jgi:hypothetical protein
LFNSVLFCFNVPQTVVAIYVDEDPHLVRKAFFKVVEKYTSSCNTVLEERGETKLETTVVFA